jgi:RNA polymerase sigma-32 factor
MARPKKSSLKKNPPDDQVVIEVLPALEEEETTPEVLEVSDDVDALDVIEIEEPIAETADATDEPDTNKYYPTTYNPLDLYLREVSKIKPLSKEEEKAVALKYFQTKDVIAARTLIQANLWLVIKLARDYQNAARNLLDLVQEGNLGLMEAVKNFDPFREVRFPSYATWWIKAYIVRYLIANFRMVKIGTTQAQRKLFFNLKKEKEKLERQGFFPAPKLLAEKLDVRESDIVEMEQRLSANDMSVDAPLSDNPDSDMLSILPSNQESAEELLADKQSKEMLKENFAAFEKTLNEKERVIFHERLLQDEKATLQELSDKLLISKERVRQIEERLLTKLKDFLTGKIDPLEIS